MLPWDIREILRNTGNNAIRFIICQWITMSLSGTIEMRMGIRIEIYNTRFRMTNYPIFSIVNTVFYLYCISWNVIVNEVIMCRADGRQRLTLQRVTGW